MSVYFVDSSALVKRYRQEAGSDRVMELLDAAERLITARLAHVEVSAAIVRRSREAAVAPGELARVLDTLDRDMRDSFDVVEMDTPLIERAIAMTRKHGLRAADALQLACALVSRGETPAQEIILMSSDQELNTAGTAEGLSVLDPTHA